MHHHPRHQARDRRTDEPSRTPNTAHSHQAHEMYPSRRRTPEPQPSPASSRVPRVSRVGLCMVCGAVGGSPTVVSLAGCLLARLPTRPTRPAASGSARSCHGTSHRSTAPQQESPTKAAHPRQDRPERLSVIRTLARAPEATCGLQTTEGGGDRLPRGRFLNTRGGPGLKAGVVHVRHGSAAHRQARPAPPGCASAPSRSYSKVPPPRPPSSR